MNRIQELFRRKKNDVLSVYCTAGFPRLKDTLDVINALREGGAEMIELGIPYSDPLTDGPVIQHSSMVALQNGMTLKELFEQLKDFRKSPESGGIGNNLPVLLMGYMNSVLQYGFDRFCSDAASAGIDGLILPDLPQYEYETEYGVIIKKYGLDFVFLVTPETSEERVKKLDELSQGFLYAVSSSSTTGRDKNMNDVNTYLQKLKNLQLKNPVMVGFGIKDRQTFRAACENANGAIIGTAFIKALEHGNNIKESTMNFLNSIIFP
ncbi:MAG TPA: tryptophan synthase subunit alpha [Chitinophagaceae bacterium]|jgi:tryptophan synthase alpha chain